ncbi:hypothetical protein LX16_1912 [Stackebrandtia albiflava]|uniref:Uncharacterized protein n=1 Tax=Stackebrandtia albiflava TaxID=406432 RepID=A0A562VEE5_9ACTN|nr:hypothetical protein [Stackebrandtia albiflava]TWJ16187.1 hypothetical protein LX16_1912 [Stackebrandtia albiflava]
MTEPAGGDIPAVETPERPATTGVLSVVRRRPRYLGRHRRKGGGPARATAALPCAGGATVHRG